MTQPSNGPSLLARNRHRFEELTGRAEQLLREGRFSDAAGYAQAAAQYAWFNHPGFFIAPRLEATLAALARQVPASTPPVVAGFRSNRRRILHVLTRSTFVGGNPAMIARWMRKDRASVHSLVITDVLGTGAAPFLEKATVESGGEVVLLSSPATDLLGRAAELRRHLWRSDLIVLHVHPSDIIPVLALIPGIGLPPVLYSNHADHVFWLRPEGHFIVAHIRRTGMDLAIRRREILEERCRILPIPLEDPPPPISRSRDRREVSLVTIAAPYKFSPWGGMDFHEAALRILEREPAARIAMVGPPHRGRWAELSARTGGRFRAIGERPGVSDILRESDIFVNSIPLGGLTALLEAALHRLPAATYVPTEIHADSLFSDDDAIPPELHRTPTFDAFVDRVSRLIRDADYRESQAQELFNRVVAAHTGSPWVDRLESIYAQVFDGKPRAEQPCGFRPDLEQVDLWLAVMQQIQNVSGYEATMWTSLRNLSTRQRIATATRLLVQFGRMDTALLNRLLSKTVLRRLKLL